MSKGYSVIYRNKENSKFWNLFEELISNFQFIGHSYTEVILEYYLIRARDSGYLIKDLSCIFLFDGEPFSAFIGAQFSKDGVSKLNFFEIPCLAIDSLNLSRNKKKYIQSFAESLLTKNVDFFQVKGPDFDTRLPILCEFLLSKNKFKIKPVTYKIIDLNLDEIELKRAIRKSFHSLINWGLSKMTIKVHDSSNIKWEIIEKFRRLHIKEAKRETRSINTWRKQFDAISNGKAFCITAHLNDELLSAAYFIINNKVCYYASSASRRDFFNKPINHAIIWSAILESKRKSAYLFNIGATYQFISDELVTEKEKNIAYFKEGFGGKLVINYLVENIK